MKDRQDWTAAQLERPKPFNPDDRKLDREVKHLCTAMNRLPGIVTTESCCGHGKQPYRIWFWCESITSAGLRTLARATCDRYYGMQWQISIDHGDVTPVHFLLEAPKGPSTFEDAENLATILDEHVERKTGGYNILFDEFDNHEHPAPETPEHPWTCGVCSSKLEIPSKPTTRVIEMRCCEKAPKLVVVCKVVCPKCSAKNDIFQTNGAVCCVQG